MLLRAANRVYGVVTDRAVPTVLHRGDGLRDDASLPEDLDQHGYAQVVGCAGRSGLRGCAGWRDAAGPTVVAVEAAGVPGYLTVTHISPN